MPSAVLSSGIVVVVVKDKVYPGTGDEGPEEE